MSQRPSELWSASIVVLSLKMPSRFGADEPSVDDDRLAIALAVVLRIAARSARVVVGRNPDVAEGLRRPRRVVRALRAEERTALGIPGDHRVTGARRAHLLLGDLAVRRGVVRIPWDEGADEAPACVLRPVVPHPDRSDRDRVPVGVVRVVDAAVVVRRAQDHVGVPRVDGYCRFVLAAARARALSECRVRVRRPGCQRVGADVAGVVRVVGEPHVGPWRRCGGNADQHAEGEGECPH